MIKIKKIVISSLFIISIVSHLSASLIDHLWPNLLATVTIFQTEPFFSKKKDYSKWLNNKKINYENNNKLALTWIGHSTFLIQINGLNILTDPIFYDLFPVIYKRKMPLGIPLEELPKIDIILISHNHKDHLEPKSLSYLKKDNPTILTPQGTGSWFTNQNFTDVKELDWQNEITIKNTKFIFLKAEHWSGTNLFNIDKSIAGSFMIQANDISIYFAGDSAYSKHFKKIGNQFSKIDIALLPISPIEPRKYIKMDHIDSIEAVQAFLDLKANIFIPMHWGTFSFGPDTFIEPIKLLKQAIDEKSKELRGKTFIIPKFGQKIDSSILLPNVHLPDLSNT